MNAFNMDKPEVVKIGMQHKLKQVVDAESLTIADRPIPFIDSQEPRRLH